MLTFKNLTVFRSFGRDETAATAIEYALIVSLVVLAAIVGMNSFSTSSADMWDYVVTTLDAAFKKP